MMHLIKSVRRPPFRNVLRQGSGRDGAILWLVDVDRDELVSADVVCVDVSEVEVTLPLCAWVDKGHPAYGTPRLRNVFSGMTDDAKIFARSAPELSVAEPVVLERGI